MRSWLQGLKDRLEWLWELLSWMGQYERQRPVPSLRREWKSATTAGKKAIERRVKQLEAEALGELPDGGE